MEFSRDRLTWIAYGLLAWFAYLQAAPGLVVSHLRDEFGLSYSTGGLHVAAFAAGALVAGLASGPIERAIGRRALFWSSAALMGVGAVGLTAGRAAEATIGSLLVMGVAGGLLLVTIQALLADHHGERRAVALTEANVAASVAYVVLIGALSLAAATGAGWRVGGARLAASCPRWRGGADRGVAIETPPRAAVAGGRLPAAFWVAAAMLFCTTAVEWCIAAWGASFVEDAADVSADAAVSLMVGYFGGVVVGRVAGSAARAPAQPAPAAGDRAGRHRGRVRDPVAVGVVAAGAARARAARRRDRQPVPAGPLGDRRAGAGAGAAGERAGGLHDVVRGAARAADGRRRWPTRPR